MLQINRKTMQNREERNVKKQNAIDVLNMLNDQRHSPHQNLCWLTCPPSKVGPLPIFQDLDVDLGPSNCSGPVDGTATHLQPWRRGFLHRLDVPSSGLLLAEAWQLWMLTLSGQGERVIVQQVLLKPELDFDWASTRRKDREVNETMKSNLRE